MYKLLVVLAILALVCGQSRLTSSGTWTDIVSPSNAKAVYVDKFNSHNVYSKVISGVKWIWDNNGINTPKGDTIKVEHLFWSKCSQPAVLKIAAYGAWKVYFDGTLVKAGITWKTATTIDLTPKCGKHNITIIVTKTVSNDWAGLTFILQQDQSKCKCNSNGWWNPYICKCECLEKCDCPTNKFWVSYPTCSCKCKPQKTSLSFASRSNIVQSTLLICPRGQYWSSKDCKCMCLPRWCPSGWYYNKTPTGNGECKCWPAIP